jgi:hypothetical protein
MGKKNLVFKWGWCGLCKSAFLYCPVCGNNSCNGGSGELENGEDCPYCIMTYQYDELAHKYIINPIIDKTKDKNKFDTKGFWMPIIKKLNKLTKEYDY